MSIPDRLFRLSKAYLGTVRDRIDDALTEKEAAVRELEGKEPGAWQGSDDSDSLLRRAEEKIAAERRKLEAQREALPQSPATTAPPTVTPVNDPHAADYRVLGVAAGSDFATVQAAYDKLVRRLDLTRFEREEDRAEAQRILERVNAAYDTLRKRLDSTTDRFAKLEL